MFYLFLVLTLLPYILPIHINAINLMDIIHRSRERDQRQQGAVNNS
jgi:hypothetical protein